MDGVFSLPIPMMTLLTSGKLAAGKQNLIKEILILPQPGTPMKKVPFLFIRPSVPPSIYLCIHLFCRCCYLIVVSTINLETLSTEAKENVNYMKRYHSYR